MLLLVTNGEASLKKIDKHVLNDKGLKQSGFRCFARRLQKRADGVVIDNRKFDPDELEFVLHKVRGDIVVAIAVNIDGDNFHNLAIVDIEHLGLTWKKGEKLVEELTKRVRKWDEEQNAILNIKEVAQGSTTQFEVL